MQVPRSAALTALAFTAGLAVLAHAPAHAQGLNGQMVNVTILYPNKATVYEDEGTKTVASAGTTFLDTHGNTTTTVTPGQVVFTFTATGTFGKATFGEDAFNGFRIAETGGAPATITGVSLDSSSSLSGFDASRISFDTKDVFANVQGLSFVQGQNVTLDLSFLPPTPAAVPEPSATLTFALAALGLGGLMVAARKKKANTAA